MSVELFRNPRSHVFISYARSDGEESARQIHDRLEADGVTCWRDRLDLEGGEGFWRQLEKGIADARWVLIVLTPNALQSEWTAKEWRYARKVGVPVCPVWPFRAAGLGEELNRSRLPVLMRESHIYTPFAWDDAAATGDSEEWLNLVATLRTERTVAPVPHMGPGLPDGHVKRASQTHSLISALRSGAPGATRPTAVLWGAGGLGKSTLAAAVAHLDDVVDEFTDGVLWVTLGTRPALVERLGDLCRTIGDRPVSMSGLDAALSQLRQHLEQRRCLLVIDDVWNAADLVPFLGLGERVKTLVTTRVAEIARLVPEGARVQVVRMLESESRLMLLSGVPELLRGSAGKRCERLAALLGHWPLLLSLAAGQLKAQFAFGETLDGAFDWIEDNLRSGGVMALGAEDSERDFDDPSKRARAFATSIGGSLSLLAEQERQAFLSLGVFPEDVEIPLKTVRQAWGVTDAKSIGLKLANLSLVDLQLGERPRITIHDEILSYAAQRLKREGSWTGAHGHLADAWGDPASLPDEYSWRWVCHHLKEAQRQTALNGLLFDFAAVQRRLESPYVGVERLVLDYGLINHTADGAHLERAVERAAYVLASHPGALAQQLLARITLDTPLCEGLRAQAHEHAPPEYLLSRTPSLASVDDGARQLVQHGRDVTEVVWAGNDQIVTAGQDGRVFSVDLDGARPVLLASHDDEVWNLLVTADGRVVSGGYDGHVYCSRPGTEEPVLVVEHEWPVYQVALTSDGRVVTGGRDGRVYLSSLDGGQSILLSEQEGSILALALTSDERAVIGGSDGTVRALHLADRTSHLVSRHEGPIRQLLMTDDGYTVTRGDEGSLIRGALDGGPPVRIGSFQDALWTLALIGRDRIVAGDRTGQVFCASIDGTSQREIGQHDAVAGIGMTHLAVVDDAYVVSGGMDGKVFRLSLTGGSPVLLARHEEDVTGIVLFGREHVVSGGEDGKVMYSRVDGTSSILLARHQYHVVGVHPTPDGRLISTDKKGNVFCSHLDGRPTIRIARHEGAAKSVLVAGDGRVVTGGEDGRVFCSWLDRGVPVVKDGDGLGGITRMQLAGDRRVVLGDEGGLVVCTDLDGREPGRMVRHQGRITQLRMVGPERVLTGGADGRVYAVNLDGGDAHLLVEHTKEVSHLYLPGGGVLVTGGADGRVFRVKVDGSQRPLELVRHEDWVFQIALAPAGRVVTNGADGRVYCARPDGGRPVLLAKRGVAAARMALTPNGQVLIGDTTGDLFRVGLDGGPLVPVTRHGGGISEIELTPDGRVVTGGSDGRVYCCRLDGSEPVLLAAYDARITEIQVSDVGRVVARTHGGEIHSVPIDGGESALLARHDGLMTQIALIDAAHVLSTGDDGRIVLSRVDGTASRVISEHPSAVAQVALTPGGRLISSHRDGTLLVVDLLRGEVVQRFFSDWTLEPLGYHEEEHSIVAADSEGRLHVLPLGPEPEPRDDLS